MELPSFSRPASFTLAAWIRPLGGTGSSWLVGQPNGSESARLVYGNDPDIGGSAEGKVSFALAASVALSDPSDAPLDAWTFYVATVSYSVGYLGGTVSAKLYRNGAEADSLGAITALSASSDYFTIGAKAVDDASYFFKGAIDDVRIYDRALSASEIEALYQEGGYAP